MNLFLDIKFIRKETGTWLSQTHYNDQILRRFGLHDYRWGGEKRSRGRTLQATASAPATAPTALGAVTPKPPPQTQVLIPAQAWPCWPGQWPYGYGTQQ